MIQWWVESCTQLYYLPCKLFVYCLDSLKIHQFYLWDLLLNEFFQVGANQYCYLMSHVSLKSETTRILMPVKQCLCLVSMAIQEILGDQMPIISCAHSLITLCMTHRPVWQLSKTPSPYCWSAWKSCILCGWGSWNPSVTHMLFSHNHIWVWWPALVQSPLP